MRGTYTIRVKNARVQFKLALNRSLTLIRGMSATGKTTLVGLIAEYQSEGPASGVTLSGKKPCAVLSGNNWHHGLLETTDSFVFVDEGSGFVRTVDATRVSCLHYNKAQLNPSHLNERERSAIEGRLGQTGILG